MSNNALWACKNPNQNQEEYPTALCVCSAGLLRSPTMAYVLANRGYNTRSAGCYDYALIRINSVLLEWADVVFCAEQEHRDYLYKVFPDYTGIVIVLNIPDDYEYRDPELIKIIEKRVDELNVNDV